MPLKVSSSPIQSPANPAYGTVLGARLKKNEAPPPLPDERSRDEIIAACAHPPKHQTLDGCSSCGASAALVASFAALQKLNAEAAAAPPPEASPAIVVVVAEPTPSAQLEPLRNEDGSPQLHALCEMFPIMSPEERADLLESVRTEGVIEHGILLDGRVLDGRNREAVSRELGIAMAWTALPADVDPVRFVFAKNGARRNLEPAQRAAIAAELATFKPGQHQVGQLAHLPTQPEAAKLLNVGTRSVKRAAAVKAKAPEAFAAVKAGTISVAAAEKIAALATDEQRAAVVAAAAKLHPAGKRAKKTKVTTPKSAPLSWTFLSLVLANVGKLATLDPADGETAANIMSTLSTLSVDPNLSQWRAHVLKEAKATR